MVYILPKSVLPEYATDGLKQENDQYYTKESISQKYYEITMDWLKENDYDVADYTFLEPSAGTGAFFKLMPDNKEGYDIEPKCEGVVQLDFLGWQPTPDTKYIAIGNPPFGKKGAFAKTIIERLSWTKCDVVAMILPMGFSNQSVVIPKKIEEMGYYIKFCETIPDNSFITPDGKEQNINCVFVIFDRKAVIRKQLTCDSYVEAYRVSNYPSCIRGLDKIDKCDIFIEQSFYDPSKQIVFDSFNPDTKNVYTGLVIKKDKEAIVAYLKGYDWSKTRNKGNGSQVVGGPEIKQIICNGGFIDVPKDATCENYAEVYDIWTDPDKRVSNPDKIGKCHIYFDQSYNANKQLIYKDITGITDKNFIGVLIKKEVEEILPYLENYDYSKLPYKTNGRVSVKVSTIKQIICEGGFFDPAKNSVCETALDLSFLGG